MKTNPTTPATAAAQIAPTPTPWKMWRTEYACAFGADGKHPVGKFFLDPNNSRALADAEFAMAAINAHARAFELLRQIPTTEHPQDERRACLCSQCQRAREIRAFLAALP